MICLGIESSCDETGVALCADGRPLLERLGSQADLHALFGGVVPELASREHLRRAGPLLASLFADAGLSLADVDAVAVARGPGLLGSLLVGLSLAKGLCLAMAHPARIGRLLSPPPAGWPRRPIWAMMPFLPAKPIWIRPLASRRWSLVPVGRPFGFGRALPRKRFAQRDFGHPFFTSLPPGRFQAGGQPPPTEHTIMSPEERAKTLADD